MKKIGPVVLLVLLALLALLAAKRKYLTAEEAEHGAVREVVKMEHSVLRDEYAAVALLAVIVLFAFVAWAALRANGGEDQGKPPAKQSSGDSHAGAAGHDLVRPSSVDYRGGTTPHVKWMFAAPNSSVQRPLVASLVFIISSMRRSKVNVTY